MNCRLLFYIFPSLEELKSKVNILCYLSYLRSKIVRLILKNYLNGKIFQYFLLQTFIYLISLIKHHEWSSVVIVSLNSSSRPAN